ncbi:MAG: hypothetical protein JW993_18125 [Sedimentisphaerales bacterium]|nr:hypothetical protein [Sedimentisphaerales bacterium]
MRKCLFYGTVLAALANICLAAPKPAIVQGPGQWTMEVRFEPPRQIVVPRAGAMPARFWYMILSVTNRTGQDADFFPRCELMTSTFQVIPAGLNVPPVAFERVRQRHESRYPLLESLANVENRILQGEDNAKDIVLIWPDFDLRAEGFKVFITGLSNETAVVDHPVAVDGMGRPVQVYLRKTLELDYAFRGDPALRDSVEVVYQDKSWVMR